MRYVLNDYWGIVKDDIFFSWGICYSRMDAIAVFLKEVDGLKRDLFASALSSDQYKAWLKHKRRGFAAVRLAISYEVPE